MTQSRKRRTPLRALLALGLLLTTACDKVSANAPDTSGSEKSAVAPVDRSEPCPCRTLEPARCSTESTPAPVRKPREPADNTPDWKKQGHHCAECAALRARMDRGSESLREMMDRVSGDDDDDDWHRSLANHDPFAE